LKKTSIVALALVLGLFTVSQALAQVGEIVVDRSTKTKALNDYTLLTRDAIQRAWSTPISINEPGALKGQVRISYSIANDGSLRTVELVQGSGNSEMDQLLMDAIRSAAPFPAFPNDINARSVLIRANFVVADLPTVRVIVANHELTDTPKVVETRPDSNSKKQIWNVPAGSSDLKASDAEDVVAAPVTTKKYRWGLER
jgi:TonB family protein